MTTGRINQVATSYFRARREDAWPSTRDFRSARRAPKKRARTHRNVLAPTSLQFLIARPPRGSCASSRLWDGHWGARVRLLSTEIDAHTPPGGLPQRRTFVVRDVHGHETRRRRRVPNTPSTFPLRVPT